MKILILLLLSTIFSTALYAQTTSTLVIIGDSLAEGLGVSTEEAFPSILQKKIQQDGKNWKVINDGISGSTSASAASRIKWILKNPPQIAVLELGANDGLRGVNPDVTEKNLDQAITMLQAAKVKVVLAGMQMPPNYQGKNREEFVRIFPKLAKKYHIQLIPFLLVGVAGDPSLNQKDGIHPNSKGHAIVADTLYKAIKSEL
jgi:acyl-CoA thioesterase-1